MFEKRKAINAFKEHKARLNLEDPLLDNLWFRQLQDIVSKYIGPDSGQSRSLSFAGKPATSVLFVDAGDGRFRFSHEKAIEYIESYIYFIRHNGVYKAPTNANNVLGTLDNATFFTVLIAALTVSYWIGFWRGEPDPMITHQPHTNNLPSDTTQSKSKAQTLDQRDNAVREKIDTLIPTHK